MKRIQFYKYISLKNDFLKIDDLQLLHIHAISNSIEENIPLFLKPIVNLFRLVFV